MDNKTIVLACEIYPPDIGGPATYAQVLVESLKSKGFSVEVLTFGDRGNKGDKENKNIHIVPRSWPLFIRLLVYFFILWKLSHQADVIYAMGPVASGLPSIVVGSLRRKRVVVRVAGDRAWETAQMKGSGELFEEFQTRRHGGWVGVMERIERFVVRRADAVVAPSKFLQRVVMGWGADEARVRVIANSIDEAMAGALHAAPVNTENRQACSLLVIGRLVPWKGFDDAIRALRHVRRLNPSAKLLIVGDGPDGARLEGLARDEVTAGSVRFVGSVPHELLSEYWNQASVFLLPSGYEGFAHLILEAWAAGVPVIASAIPANAELVRDGDTGILVPYRRPEALAEAVVRLLRDHALRARLVGQGKAELERYRRERVFDETLRVLLNEEGR